MHFETFLLCNSILSSFDIFWLSNHFSQEKNVFSFKKLFHNRLFRRWKWLPFIMLYNFCIAFIYQLLYILVYTKLVTWVLFLIWMLFYDKKCFHIFRLVLLYILNQRTFIIRFPRRVVLYTQLGQRLISLKP